MPAFFALLPVRDEADIIGQCLDHALRWADEIYVFDTGSVDNAWEIVQEFASRDKRVVPMRKRNGVLLRGASARIHVPCRTTKDARRRLVFAH